MGGDEWINLVRTDDVDRIEQVLALLRQQVAPERYATGAEDLLGLGLDYTNHHAIDLVVYGLGRFPGRGADIILAALRNPVTRVRGGAGRTLSAWGEVNWPAGLRSALEAAAAVEPVEAIREGMNRVLAGMPYDAPPTTPQPSKQNTAVHPPLR